MFRVQKIQSSPRTQFCFRIHHRKLKSEIEQKCHMRPCLVYSLLPNHPMQSLHSSDIRFALIICDPEGNADHDGICGNSMGLEE